MTEKKFGKMLYKFALSQDFREESGTPYPCKQSEIDFHRNGVFDKPNKGPFVSLLEATEEILRWNDEKRAPSREESEIIQRLSTTIREVGKDFRFGPDLLIKTWADLDSLFFAGRLRDHVLVRWVKRIDGGLYGHMQFYESETTKGLIEMSAEVNLLPQKWRRWGEDYNPVVNMFSTILHEMCHAYELVRSPYEPWNTDIWHDPHFQTKISVVHDRATRLLGIPATADWEEYKQHHFLPMEGEKGQEEGNTKEGGDRKREESSVKQDGDRKRAWIAIASAICVGTVCVLLLWLEVFAKRDVPRPRGGTAVEICVGISRSKACVEVLL